MLQTRWATMRSVKQFVCVLAIVCLSIFSCPLTSLAVTIQDVPNPRQMTGEWVSDLANLLDVQMEMQLNQAISELEEDEGIEIAVVTVPDTSPSASPEEFATQLFNDWGIGKRGQNNGVLLLVSKGDRQVEIKTGSGIMDLLPNSQLQSTIDTDILPRFRSGNFAEGIWVGTQSLIQAVRTVPDGVEPELPSLQYSPVKPNIYIIVTIVTIVLAIGCLMIFLTLQPPKVNPQGRSSRTDGQRDLSLVCNRCRLAMQPVDAQTLLTYLTPAQSIARALGGVVFEGWQCPPECRQAIPPAGIHLREYILDNQQFQICPNCRERTMQRSEEVLVPATITAPGKRRIHQQCHSCLLVKEQVETIAPGSPVYNADGVYIGSVTYSASSSDSFGGGDGGGGGASGGW
ncbi:TPM domain-containing protein [Chamaesiphon sp. VAR_48_metabat_403]|uniref:TPM domain-containing protein n=1 Tax=Chamaesiphon sp. VAR_48_metabat_403 TaxID=2964700 RepID=UPI00286E9FF4|nr:TPM domain-containing protein [Chamaesiphon sp. VAR_48_metabat_403]